MTPLTAVSLALALSITCSGAGAMHRSSNTSIDPARFAAAPAGACSTTLVAAGDIVNDFGDADATGRLAASQHPDRVLVLGDSQYPTGSLTEYRTGYDRTAWGRLKSRTRPVPGNHEYLTSKASGYFAYFGSPPYYAFELGCGWRAYALDSEQGIDEQARWLRRDLSAHPTSAVVAYWHRPRWSSGVTHGSDPTVQPFWTALSGRHGVVLNGHEHNYERFAPLGQMRALVVGTGGTSTYAFGHPMAGSQRRIAHTPGVLRLVVSSNGRYQWAFLDARNTQVLDRGAG